MTTSESSPLYPGSPFQHDRLTNHDRELLYYEDIQRTMIDLPHNLHDRNVVHDRYQSYDFFHANIHDAKLPDIVEHMVHKGFFVKASIQFTVSEDHKSTNIGTFFTLSRDKVDDKGHHSEEQVVFSAVVEPDSDKPFRQRTTSLENGVEIHDAQDTGAVSEPEVYDFLASIATRNNESLAIRFLAHPGQYKKYLHNPFSFDHLDSMFNQHADDSFREELYKLDDPTTLPLYMIVAYEDDRLLRVEAEFWNDHDKHDSICVCVLADTAEIPQQDITPVNSMDFSFGVDEPTVEKPLSNQTIVFETHGAQYQPSLRTLDEIRSRIVNTANYIAQPVTEIPYSDDIAYPHTTQNEL